MWTWLYTLFSLKLKDRYLMHRVGLDWRCFVSITVNACSRFVPEQQCSFSGYPPGAYSCLRGGFVISRNLGFFLIQFYIPSVLLVILSWVSFWISVDAVVARVNIGLLTVLTLTTQSTGSSGQLPRVSYIKAIDVWMSTCLVFAFASLIEFALVNVWSRREARRARTRRAGQGQKMFEDIPLQQVRHESNASINQKDSKTSFTLWDLTAFFLKQMNNFLYMNHTSVYRRKRHDIAKKNFNECGIRLIVRMKNE